MVNRETLIARIEQELVQAEQAQHDHDFEKHMYAIHILTSYMLQHQIHHILVNNK